MGPVRLPILYADGTAMLAFFWVDPVRARRLLEGSGLEPLRFPGRRALLALGFYDYRETTIGPYHEVGSALAVVPTGAPSSGLAALELVRAARRRRAGYHILDLPVSTPIADVGGRELWGLPKFLTQLPLRVGTSSVEGQVLDSTGAAPLLTLSGTVALALARARARPGAVLRAGRADAADRDRRERTIPLLVRGRGQAGARAWSSSHDREPAGSRRRRGAPVHGGMLPAVPGPAARGRASLIRCYDAKAPASAARRPSATIQRWQSSRIPRKGAGR